MGNNASRNEQWSPDPIKKVGPFCGNVQESFPRKVCNLTPGHEGSHCHESQAGTQLVRIYWK